MSNGHVLNPATVLFNRAHSLPNYATSVMCQTQIDRSFLEDRTGQIVFKKSLYPSHHFLIGNLAAGASGTTRLQADAMHDSGVLV